MSSVLTPEETAALRENMQSEAAVGAAAAADAAAAAPADPAAKAGRPSVFMAAGARGHPKKLPALERRFEVMTERLRILFSRTLRMQVAIEPEPIGLLSAAEMGSLVPSFAVSSQMRWSNLGHAGFVGLNMALSYAFIELAYGAPPQQLQTFVLKQGRARLTEVERQTLAPLLQSLARALAEVMPPHVVGQATSAPMSFPVQIDPDKTVEGGLQKTFSFKIGETRAVVHIVLFLRVLEHLDDVAPAHFEQTAQLLAAHCCQTDVEVKAVLGSASVPLAQVVDFKPGDLLWLDRAQTDYLPVYVEQAVKFLAQPIARNGALGVEIMTRIA